MLTSEIRCAVPTALPFTTHDNYAYTTSVNSSMSYTCFPGYVFQHVQKQSLDITCTMVDDTYAAWYDDYGKLG